MNNANNIVTPERFKLSPNSVEQRIFEVMRRLGGALELTVDLSLLNLGDFRADNFGLGNLGQLIEAARMAGIVLRESALDPKTVHRLVVEGFPVVVAVPDGTFWIFERWVRRSVEASRVDENVDVSFLRLGKIRKILREFPDARVFVVKKDLECNSLSDSDPVISHGNGGHGHTRPTRRFLALLRMDQRDIWTIMLFAMVAGVLSMATPLAVESLVNVVGWGTYLQPLVVLGLMLLTCLGLAGVLRVLQTIIVEIIQRRQFVRIIGDLAHRFPRANRQAIEGYYPRELANRLFDIMTIQKASATLLLDGTSILLTTATGMVLLAFYHPFLLGFDIVLLISMISATWLLGRGGIRTAIDESIAKYKVIHWLQDVLATPAAFKVNGGEHLAVEQANRLTTEYLLARQSQFRVVLRQVAFAIGLQVIASTALLGLGGWLVMKQQLTLGQLVASELVVTVVVGAFAKAGKALEKYYDLMAGIDKVGHLLDIPVDPRQHKQESESGPVEVRWEQLEFHTAIANRDCRIPAGNVAAGRRVAVIGTNRAGKSMLIKSLAGLLRPKLGLVEIGGEDAWRASLDNGGRLIGYAGRPGIFHGTIQENIDLGRVGIGNNRVREVLTAVGISETILRLPDGTQTVLQSDGYPLSETETAQLGIAQAMAGQPRLLLIDRLLDELPPQLRQTVWQSLTAPNAPWTLIVATGYEEIAAMCDLRIEIHD